MRKISLFILLLIGISSCSDVQDIQDITVEDQEVALAFPVVNTQFNISDFTSGENAPDNVSIRVDGEERVTLIYNGDVVEEPVTNVFPAVPFFGFPVLDTLVKVPIPFANDQRIDLATLGNTNIIFSFRSVQTEDVNVKVVIPQLTKDGEPFEETYTIAYDGSTPTEFSPPQFYLEDWDLVSQDNEITVIYDARLSNGERITLDGMSIVFDQIIFKYIEGYFGRDIFDISGDFVAVGVLENWVSGGLVFEDPKVNIFVENAFGFPVRSVFNKMQVETTIGESLDMESEIIDDNVDFAFPSIDERGESKITSFAFTKENSNIKELFKEKVTKVTYDIDALVNGDDDTSILQFVSEESFFKVKVDVELPLEGSINNLILQDNTEIDLGDAPDDSSLELKVILANDFPADVTLQSYFLDDNGSVIDSLFDDGLLLPAAQVDAEGISLGGEEITTFINYDSAKYDRIRGSKNMNVRIKINTEDSDVENPLWIYNDYGIKMRAGAILTTKL